MSKVSPWGSSLTGSPRDLEAAGPDLDRPLRRLARRRVVHEAAEVHLVVEKADLVRVADRQDVPALDQHRPVTEALDQSHVVRHEEDRLAGVLQAVEHLEALLLERGVAHREHLVHEQHLRVHLRGDREAEPHPHAGGVVLQLEVHELLELGERDDVGEAAAGLGAREAHHHRVDHDVVLRREIRVEADAELDERREPPLDGDRALRRAGRCRRCTSAACSCRIRCARRSRRTHPAVRRPRRRSSR